jgi:hypothetical protein
MTVADWSAILNGVQTMMKQMLDAVLERLAAVQAPADAEPAAQERLLQLLVELQARRVEDEAAGRRRLAGLEEQLAGVRVVAVSVPHAPVDADVADSTLSAPVGLVLQNEQTCRFYLNLAVFFSSMLRPRLRKLLP